jgi:hypothetical protein
MKTDRQKSSALMAEFMPHVTAIWASDPTTWALGQFQKPKPPEEVERAKEELERIFTRLLSQVESLSAHELVGALRGTFSVASCIPSWKKLLSEGRRVLTERGEENVDRLLVGLDRTYEDTE